MLLKCPSCGWWGHESKAETGQGLGDDEIVQVCPKCGTEVRPFGRGEKG